MPLTDPSQAASAPSNEQFGYDRVPKRFACRIETKKSSSHDDRGDAFSLTDRIPVDVLPLLQTYSLGLETNEGHRFECVSDGFLSI